MYTQTQLTPTPVYPLMSSRHPSFSPDSGNSRHFTPQSRPGRSRSRYALARGTRAQCLAPAWWPCAAGPPPGAGRWS